MVIEGVVGPRTVSDGAEYEARMSRDCAIIVQDAHGRLQEPAYRQGLFTAATGSGQTTTIGLAATYVGLCLSNPLGNNKNLAVLKVGWAWSVIATAINAIGLLAGYSATANVTHSAAVTPASTLVGTGPLATAKVDTSAALVGTPYYLLFAQSTPTAVTNPSGGVIDLDGSIIIPPGGYIATATVAASATAAFWASFLWEEIPL